MSYYPVFLNLKGRNVLVVGGGAVALRKVRTLLEAGAVITVASPELCDGLAAYRDSGEIECMERPFRHDDITDDIWLIVAATDNPAVQKEIAETAERRKIFCNVVDHPELSSFIVPSSLRKGDITISISTGGQSPAVAKLARKELDEFFDHRWMLLLEIASRLRKMVLSSNLDSEEKHERCKKIGNPDVLGWMDSGDREMIEKWIDALMEGISSGRTASLENEIFDLLEMSSQDK